MGDIGAESLDVRFPVEKFPTELQPVVAQFNELLARLALSFEREKRVNADLAHELRTPVAELRLLAETAIKWPETRGPDTDRDALAVAVRMEGLVQRMLFLARGEQPAQAQVRPVDLDALIRDAWRPFAAKAESRGLTIHFKLEVVRVQSEPVLLRSILTNLLENAAVYCAEGGIVSVTSGRDGDGRSFVRVANTTKDLAPEDTSHLFERYWRKEAARGGEELHIGLGLTIVRTFSEMLGYGVSATLESDTLGITLSGIVSE